MKILPLSKKLEKYLKFHHLTRKYQKQIAVLGKNPRHPSLNLEILEPKNRGIYSFRLDKKYRGLFIYRDDLRAIEIIAATCHYH
jgi:Txe/YoeB family toxin of Txe-Axe toxin-antitoxin module